MSPLSGASIDVQQDGGYAALSIRQTVRHDDRTFVYVSRRICGTTCAAPSDSARVALTPAATDSLFTEMLARDPFGLKDDYGRTQGGADMFDYTVRITANGATKTTHFDSGTMPEPMRQILGILQSTLSAARR